MLPNPYTPGQVPRVFVGRATELARIRSVLTKVDGFGELGGPLLVYHGPRGVGKTSLLRAAQADAQEAGFVTAWVSCAPRASLLAELAHSVERALRDAPQQAGAGRRLRLSELQVEIGALGSKVSASLRPESAAATGVAPIGATVDLLHRAATAVREGGGAGLLVFLDELHAAPRHDLAVLLNAVQVLDGERQRNPLALFAAGLPSTSEAVTRAATFGERSTFLPLNRLGESEALATLLEPAAELGVRWSQTALRAIVGSADGYPYFLQLLGSTTWEAALPDQGAVLDLADVRAGLPDAGAQLDALYRGRWRAASPLEQELMIAMAQAGTERVARGDIAARLGRHTRELSVPRDRLIEKGIVEPAGYGLLRFTLPGFASYVAREAGLDAPRLTSGSLLELPETED